jgi:hypothetical protein
VHPRQVEDSGDLASAVIHWNSFIEAERIEQLPLARLSRPIIATPQMPSSPHRW